MKINHIGYAVKNMDKAIRQYELLGYDIGEVIQDNARNIEIAFAKNGDYMVELVAPLSKGSPVDNIIKTSGNTPYHICYETDDLDKEIAYLESQKYKVTIPPTPACAFHGRRVVFMYHLTAGLIEIVERGKENG